MNRRKGTWRTGLAVVLAVTGAAVLPSAHAAGDAPSAATKLQDDFNGDGYSDLAVAAPEATVDGKTRAGYVAVLYGSASGLKTTSKQVISQNTAGVTDSAETGDLFGSAVSSEDLDQDGYDDLIVGVTGEDSVEGGAETGLVQVVWGGANGLSGGAALAYGHETYDRLSARGELTVGDVNGDGAPDLVVIERNYKLRVIKGPFGRDGAASGEQTVLDNSDPRFLDLATGDVNGDGIDDVVGAMNDGDEYDHRRITYWRGTPDGLAEKIVLEDSRGFWVQGESLDLGDVNGDGYDDIVAGRSVDGYDSDLDTPLPKGGRVGFVPGSADGPVVSKAMYVNQDSAGVPGAAERGDGFGSDVSVADVNGDGYADVSTGVPGEDFDGLSNAGGAIVLRGGANGLTGAGATGVNQDTTGVPGAAETNDAFGATTHLVDANHDGRAELVVGATGENANAGSVWVFQPTSTGITPTGSFTFGAGTLGTVATNAKLGSGFNY
ncbi:FG-GAP-like repeat-containing protein [Streptomyces sp. AS02]|uniref:FG-GAP-like repeat-containing protein n=1 Tax=Streptomyces sp. AS02 TaxID=2938946 RepID=UPI002021E469|nr:FG-GAP-like repeat-containing protein [Streptomyces sp. AS02]MCL8014742.1 FG-GAP-like repeat-containing protein [Streptomyces sp. AS02]